jgi:hypothetical protein
MAVASATARRHRLNARISLLLVRENDTNCGAIMPRKGQSQPTHVGFDDFSTRVPLQAAGQTFKIVVYSYDADKVGSITARLK